MQVGSISEKVEVSATTSLVETKENSISSVIDQQRINDLPLNGRQATQLILTLGAAVLWRRGDTGSKTFWNATRISVAGGQGNGTAYLLDGGDATDAMSNVNMPFPFPDALQEFSIETSAVSSRFGTHPGATVNVVTKSGSNADSWRPLRIHPQWRSGRPQLLFTHRRRHAEAKSIRRNRRRQDHQGQAVLLRRISGHASIVPTRPQSTTHIPTAAMLNGRLQHHRLGRRAQRQSPATCTTLNGGAPFAGNQIPVSLLNPVAVTIATKYIPISSANQCGKVTLRHPSYRRLRNSTSAASTLSRAKNTRCTDATSPRTSQNPPTYRRPEPADDDPSRTTWNWAQSATIGDNYTFGPGTLNSFHVSFNRIRDNRGPTTTPINWT